MYVYVCVCVCDVIDQQSDLCEYDHFDDKVLFVIWPCACLSSFLPFCQYEFAPLFGSVWSQIDQVR